MAAELPGDDGDRHLGVQQAEDGAAFLEREVAVGAVHPLSPAPSACDG
jgi:hypothetical protein